MGIEPADPGKLYPEKTEDFARIIGDSLKKTEFSQQWEPIKKQIDKHIIRIRTGGVNG